MPRKTQSNLRTLFCEISEEMDEQLRRYVYEHRTSKVATVVRGLKLAMAEPPPEEPPFPPTPPPVKRPRGRPPKER
jgi:hypothetical protein